MRVDLEAEIFARWPAWFAYGSDVTRSLMGLGFQCGDGWFRLVVATFEAIEPHVEAFNRELEKIGTHFEVLEVKEKFGELRIIAMPTNQAIWFAFLDARERSRTICEVCGAPGNMLPDPCRVRCDRCERGEPEADQYKEANCRRDADRSRRCSTNRPRRPSESSLRRAARSFNWWKLIPIRRDEQKEHHSIFRRWCLWTNAGRECG